MKADADAPALAQPMQAAHWAVLIVAALMFGSAFSFTRIAVAELPPLTVAAGRALLAAAVLLGLLALTGDRLPARWEVWRQLIVLGIFTGAVPFAAFAWGQVKVHSSVAGILFGATPIFTLLVAHFATSDERLTAQAVAGVALGFAGVGLVVGPAAIGGLGDDLSSQGLILLAAACLGFGSVYARRLHAQSPAAVAASQAICAAAILVPLSLLLESPWRLSPGQDALAAVAALGVIGTAAPVPAVFWLIRSIGATRASLMAYFIPVVAVLVGVFALGESPRISAIAGCALIIVGAAIPPRRAADALEDAAR